MSRLQEYRTFVTIVEKHSLTHAAQQLHRSTSAISKQLSKLEEDLGVQLVDRTTQSLVITHLGEQFYQQCKEILNSVDEAERSVKDGLQVPSGKLSISMPEVLLQTDLVKYLNEFCERYPDVKVNISVSNEVEDLLQNQHDFAFRIANVDDARLVALPLSRADFLAVASPRYLEREGVPSNLQEVVDKGHFVLPIWANVARTAAAMKTPVNIADFNMDRTHTASSTEALMAMVKAGLGVTLALNIALDEDLESGALVQLFPDDEFLERQIHLIYRSRNFMPRLMTIFKEFVQEKCLEGVRF